MRVRTMAILAAFGAVLARPGTAQGDRAGDFDYYVMALSWSPSWCDIEGETEGQCAPERDAGWLLHGLWPLRNGQVKQLCDLDRRLRGAGALSRSP